MFPIAQPTRPKLLRRSGYARLMQHCMRLLTGLLVLLAATAVSAAVITVDDLGDAGVGCTLRKAIANANNGDRANSACAQGDAGANTINLPTGTITLSAGTLFIANNNLTISGNGVANTVISGGTTQRIFDTSGGGSFSLVLSNMTVQNGNAAASDPDTTNAAALFVENTVTATVDHCVFQNNVADSSGGAIENRGDLTVTSSTFSNNAATNGSGGAIYSTGTLTITDSSFTNNTALNYGTAIYTSGTYTVTNVTINGTVYNAGQPAITSLATAAGPIAGGTSVVITGTGFDGATAVKFGSTNATSFTVDTNEKITATAPAHAAGAVNITVTTPVGTSNTSASDQYTYMAAPTVTSISPTAGPPAGGTSVTITGTNFAGTPTVTIGGAAASGITVVDATTITATTPAGTAGARDVVVTTPGGSGTGTGLFTYIDAPTVTAISPTAGPTAGGTSVTITGTNLTGTTAVTIGGTSTTFTQVNATTVTATTPAGSAGTVDVRVTTAGGTSATSASDQFTYVAPPMVTSISPTAGPTAGGTSVVITGTNLTNATAVKFGAADATGFTVNSATQITATAPAGAAGTIHITVTTAGGTSATSASDQFTYVAAPTVTSIAPTAGPTAGGTSVVITGTNLTAATAITFGATSASSYTVNSATQITATAPAGSGTVDVRVTTAGGTSATSASDQFTYTALPTVTGISPTAGPTAGGTSVIITGTNLTNATAVKFGAANATGFTVNSATQITATAPSGAVGMVDITVTTAGGTSATGASDQFTYVAAPTVSSISPTAGPTAGGTNVVITGTNLANATAVKFGTTNATGFTVNSATQITATSPAGAVGMIDITVTTAGGTSATSASDQFNYVLAPVVSSIAPVNGPVAGGTSVVITGANFTGATTVKFGGANATNFVVDSATQITAIAPAGSAGAVDVTVTTPIGTSATSANDQFTYVAAPAVSALEPASGPIAGGTSVVITGTNLTNATAVKFGAANAASFVLNSASQITATSPAGVAGKVDVTVITAGGTSATGASDQYTYVAGPTISAVSPASGSILGGTSVVITGTNLTAATAVKFGATNAASFTVNSATQITATAPAGSVGVVDITVTTAGGTSAIVVADQFTYDAKTFTGNLPGGGTATASFTGGGASCSFASAQFVSAASVATPPAGVNFNLGLFDFQLTGCTNSSTITMSIEYTGTPGSIYWKYGPTAADHSNHWYQFVGATFTGNTVSFSITDGGLGDDDLSANGSIVDAGGPASPAALAPVPTLGEWASGLLIALMMMLGFGTLRRNQHAG